MKVGVIIAQSPICGAYRGGGEKPCIVYEYQATRGGYHAQQFLGGI